MARLVGSCWLAFDGQRPFYRCGSRAGVNPLEAIFCDSMEQVAFSPSLFASEVTLCLPRKRRGRVSLFGGPPDDSAWEPLQYENDGARYRGGTLAKWQKNGDPAAIRFRRRGFEKPATNHFSGIITA